MLQFLWLTLITFYVVLSGSAGQSPNFNAYTTVSQFSCLDPISLQRIILTQRCGVLISPCYPDNYPEELGNGVKLWDINANDESNVPVVAYRFTLNHFETDEIGGNLDFSTSLTFDPVTNINLILRRQRIVTIAGESNQRPGARVRIGRRRERRLQGQFVDLNETRLYVNFYASRETPLSGFNISYCADFDQCHSNYRPVLCDPNNSEQCVRNGFNNYSCICSPGFIGVRCDIDINECNDNPCAGNAVCVNTVGSFQCRCRAGYSGDGFNSCADIDECVEHQDDCADSTMATCANTEGSFTCTCKQGFSGDGRTCINVNECAESHSCDSNAACIDTPGSYLCTCYPGYSGNGFTCQEVDECELNICHQNASCTNLPGSFTCTCSSGLNDNGTDCVDINECLQGIDDCAKNNAATCINTFGSFQCVCKSGYSGDGRTCVGINECLSSPCHRNADCFDTALSFICSCKNGYTGDGFGCNDLDECRESQDDCAGFGASTCTNTNGSFTCSCTQGFSGDGRTCININECTRGNPCHPNATCQDTIGSFNCACNLGFSGNGTACSDVNECLLGNSCDVNADCDNTDGSFTCLCKNGYVGDGRICRDVDECTLNPCDVNAVCRDMNAAFSCSCNEGFTGNGFQCVDFNECVEDTHDCSKPAGNCLNTFGSFTCSCRDGYDGDGRICINENECESNPCHTDAMCTDTIGSFQCTCRAGFVGNGFECADIDECAIGRHNCRDTIDETCTNTAGSFLCTCNTPAYRGTPPNCQGFFCPGVIHALEEARSGLCTRPGLIEWPNFYDNNRTYERSQIVSWLVSFTGRRRIIAIRFKFLGISVESPQDYIIFSNQPRVTDLPRLAAFTGTLNTTYNFQFRANSSNPIGYDDSTKTYLVKETEVYIHFYSDRGNVSTGFQIRYDPVENVDECTNANPCVNGGICVDQSFSYTCINCNLGYTGQNCSEDIDECSENLDDCSPDADCVNTDGSFSCLCRNSFTGNGTFCDPYILLSDFTVVPTNNRTVSSLVVNFKVTEPWGTNASYVANYIIRVRNVESREAALLIQIDASRITALLPFHVPVTPSTIYDVSVSLGEVGFQYLEALYNEDVSTVRVMSNSISLLPPTNLKVVFQDDVFVNVTWNRPDTERRGRILAFELGYRRNETDCKLYQILGPQTDCNSETLIRFPSIENYYLIVNLQLYRNYVVRLRAYSRAGPSDWSEAVGIFTGSVCRHQRSRARAIASPCTARFGSISSGNFPLSYMGFEQRYWQIDFRGRGAIRIVFDYFNIERNQDYLDIGQGQFPAAGPLLDTRSLITQSGNLTGRELVIEENEINNGMVFVRFESDLLSLMQSRGFQIHYETNSSRCLPVNPCQNNAVCVPANFDFECQCTSQWTSKLCNSPLTDITVRCNTESSSNISLFWSVPTAWRFDISAIPEFLIIYNNVTIRRPIETSNYTITGLSPYQLTNITVKIQPINPQALIVEASTSCRTEDGIPKAVQSISVSAISGNTIIVSWKPPRYPNGEITGYNVTYSLRETVKEHFVTTNKTAILEGLAGYTIYNVSVSVINRLGTGPRKFKTIRTLAIAPEGPVQDVVVYSRARSVLVEVVQPVVNTGDFTYDIAFTSLNRNSTVTNVRSPINITKLSPFTFYRATIYPRSGGMTGANPFLFNFTTAEDTPGPVSNLLPNQVTAYSLVLSWKPPVEPNGKITGYSVMWKVGRRNMTSLLILDNTTEYTIGGLTPFTEYSFYVFSYTAAGKGNFPARLTAKTASSTPSNVRNLLAKVNENNSITITFDQPAERNGKLIDYVIRIKQNVSECRRFNDPLEQCNAINTILNECVRAQYTTAILPSFRYFEITVAARTCAGDGPYISVVAQTYPTKPAGPVEDIRISSSDPTSVFVEWDALLPITGPVTYVVNAASRNGKISTETVRNSIDLRLNVLFTDLNPSEGYMISVTTNNTSAVNSSATSAVQLQRAPTLRSGARVLPFYGVPDLEGANPSNAFVIENPCDRKGEIFSEADGPVESIDVIVKETRTNSNQEIVVWITAIAQSPILPYQAASVQCNNNRRKRRVNVNGDGFIVGFGSCRNVTTVCNGPVLPGRRYQVAYRARNEGGTSTLTPYGGDVFLPNRQRNSTSRRLSSGEIAAIAVTLSLVFILLVFLVVLFFCQRGRLQSRFSFVHTTKVETKKSPIGNAETDKDKEIRNIVLSESPITGDVMETGKETPV